MNYEELLTITAGQPFFETGLLLTGSVNPDDIRRQLSRWVRSGRLVQLRRGLYALAAPYQLGTIHPFLVANALLPGSYISLQSALAYHGLIPEHVVRTQSVSVRRPVEWQTPLGDFSFQHIASHLFFGYQQVNLADRRQAFVASPEKALLDLVHLTPGGDAPAYLAELRLQNLEKINLERLKKLAERSGKPKWRRAAGTISRLAAMDWSEYTSG